MRTKNPLSTMLLSPVLICAVLAGCASNDPNTGERREASNTAKGAGIGAIAGAVLGAAVSHDNRGKGAAIGAVLGGGTGAAIGYRKDKQEAELREKLKNSGVGVQSDGNDIKLVLPGNISFDSGSAALRADFYQSLNQVAESLRQYPQTQVRVVGHTDSTGSAALNEKLSNDRARTVRDYLSAQGVEPTRLEYMGVGPSQPIADNKTAAGRAENRRVEIKIIAPPAQPS